MATLFIDYEKLVRQAYEQKKVSNTLPHGLMHLTPAKLKEECVMRCKKDLNNRDEKVIRDFCGDLNESKTCLAIIQRCDTDKFKPLVNFLKGKSESTGSKNIELLAWLIDFPGRPWELRKEYSYDMNESQQLGNMSPVATESDKPAGDLTIPENPIIPLWSDGSNRKGSTDAESAGIGNQRNLKGKPAKTLRVAVMLSLALGAGGIWWWKDKNRQPDPSGGCMYWIEDHYEPIPCNQKMPNAMIIALDTMKLKNFKRITMPDTITYRAIGRVWYSKIDGKIEYYTSGGEHPVVFDHRLKPITKYMIDKYILPGTIAK
jgi:hypothetical protein